MCRIRGEDKYFVVISDLSLKSKKYVYTLARVLSIHSTVLYCTSTVRHRPRGTGARRTGARGAGAGPDTGWWRRCCCWFRREG